MARRLKKTLPRVVVVLITCPTQSVARRLARQLITKRHAACVNIVPGLTSIYTWKHRVETAREVLLIIKTTARHVAPLQRAVLAHHPYQVPELVALPILQGHLQYLRWVVESVSD